VSASCGPELLQEISHTQVTHTRSLLRLRREPGQSCPPFRGIGLELGIRVPPSLRDVAIGLSRPRAVAKPLGRSAAVEAGHFTDVTEDRRLVAYFSVNSRRARVTTAELVEGGTNLLGDAQQGFVSLANSSNGSVTIAYR
jgi:hypothetical protein